jgi:anti-sigma regulatory factor (Ser/Thr protein kinase)
LSLHRVGKDPEVEHERRSEIGSDGTGGLRIRVGDAAEIGSLRRTCRYHLSAAGVPEDAIADVVLALSELTTNAIEACPSGEAVEVVVATADHPDRTVVCLVDNVGEPYPGRLEVSRLATVDLDAERGRGLAIAARLGRVELEGMIGGTRARFRRLY